MSEKIFEGSASNNFGVNYSFGGKKINFNNQYYLYGTSIDHLINEKILKVLTISRLMLMELSI